MNTPQSTKNMLLVLFREGEHTCFAGKPNGTSVFDVLKPPSWVQFFSLNPLHGELDVEGKAAPKSGRRADVNVTAFRNILLECDGKVSLDEQQAYINQLGVPWSTCVYSGGKSYHFIISLEKSLPNREAYDKVVRWIYGIVSLADQQNKNPSRLTRFPGVLRRDKNKTQELIEVRGSVSIETLFSWLRKYPQAKPQDFQRPPVSNERLSEIERGRLSLATKKLITGGAEPGERNNAAFKAACDFKQQGYSIEEAIDYLEPAFDFEWSDFTHKEFLNAVYSAYSRAPRYPPNR